MWSNFRERAGLVVNHSEAPILPPLCPLRDAFIWQFIWQFIWKFLRVVLIIPSTTDLCRNFSRVALVGGLRPSSGGSFRV
jgi:hypothetical protein